MSFWDSIIEGVGSLLGGSSGSSSGGGSSPWMQIGASLLETGIKSAFAPKQEKPLSLAEQYALKNQYALQQMQAELELKRQYGLLNGGGGGGGAPAITPYQRAQVAMQTSSNAAQAYNAMAQNIASLYR